MTLKEITHQLLTNLKYFILPNPRNKDYIKEQIAFQPGQESLLKTLWSSPGKVGQTLIWENIIREQIKLFSTYVQFSFEEFEGSHTYTYL